MTSNEIVGMRITNVSMPAKLSAALVGV